MQLFFVSFPSQEVQKSALTVSPISNHLMSFAFNREEAHYDSIWSPKLNLHLAATAGEKWAYELAASIPPKKSLLSYAYQNEKEHAIIWNPAINGKCRVIIDSGAFTAYTTGKTIRKEEYLEWATEFQKRWGDKLQSLHFMNLDVIGDAEKSEENLHWFESKGFNPIPIITTGASEKEIRRTIQNYDYFAVGGIVASDNREFVIARLNQIYRLWLDEYRKTGRMVKTHLLGVTSFWALSKYPAYSADSSSWTAPLRFGQARAAGISKIPKYTLGENERQVALHALRHEIKKFKDLERQVTVIWEKRGIVWED